MDGLAAGTSTGNHRVSFGVAGELAHEKRMNTLHRHILSLAFTRWAMLLFIGLFLIHLGDFIGQSGDYIKAIGAGRGSHLLQYFALRFPGFLAAWLPISVAAAALLCAWPMLRQGTLVALCAAGIPVRRVFASLLGLAAVIGVFSFVLQDQIIPRLDPEAKFARMRMQGELQLNQSVSRSLGWRDGDFFWCVQSAVPEDGRYDQVAVFGAGGANHHGPLVMADSLWWQNGGWRIRNPVVAKNYQVPTRVITEGTLADVGLTLSVDAATLVEQLKQDRARTSDQLFAVRSENAWGYVILRVCFGLLPFLCLMFALPSFVRLEGINRLGNALGRSVVWMLVPLLGYWLLSRILISNSTYVISGTLLVLGSLISAGSWRWWTMRL
jgi:lipopolysaccharide export LptBFGC system permease protein LptF